ncbi:replicative DNA helicase [Clostridium sp. CAG:1219]|nr:replicative DNA helicase [Clostridium sp. CAG:1219]
MESDVISKAQPNDILAEQAVLGAMLVDKDAVIASIEVLKSEDFYREDNKEIYAAMLELYSIGKSIDMITLKDQLTLRGTLDKVGGISYIASLVDNVPAVSNVENYIKIVEEKSVIRNLIKTANEIIRNSYSGTEDVDALVEQAEKRIFDVVQERNSRGYASIREILINVFDEIEEISKSGQSISGLESGFIDLDAKTSGLNKSALLIVAARPAMGKSAFVLNIASYVARHQKTPVMIFNLEMSKEEVTKRILCAESEVDSTKVKNATLESEDWLKLGEASGRLSDMPIYIDDTPGLTSAELRAKCRKAKLEKNIGLVIIDYLQLMESKNKSSSRQQEVSEISRSLKILAKELNIPVIALSQLSRATESRTDHRPMLSDLRESGSIEQDADIVMFLHREDYYDANTEKKNVAEVIIAKNRSGSTGTVELAWIPEYTKFANLYRGPDIND